MPQRTVLYSDISIRHGVAGFAIAIRSDGGKCTWIEGDLYPEQVAVVCELTATAAGIRQSPFSELLVVYSDIVSLPKWVSGELVPSQPALLKLIERIRRQAGKRKRVEYRRVNRKDGIYKECHRRARQAAVYAARRRGRLA